MFSASETQKLTYKKQQNLSVEIKKWNDIKGMNALKPGMWTINYFKSPYYSIKVYSEHLVSCKFVVYNELVHRMSNNIWKLLVKFILVPYNY
jgi:hypothetical protein